MIRKRSSVLAFLFLLVFLLSSVISAQDTFAREIALPGKPAAITVTSDGGNLLVFQKSNGQFGGRILVRKVNVSGQKVWQRELRFNQLLSNDAFRSGGGVAQLLDGSYVLTAVRDTDSHMHSDALLTKLTSTGFISWQKGFDGSSLGAEFNSVVAASDGGFFAAGQPGNIVGGGITLASFNSNGEIRWGKTFSESSGPPTLLITPGQELILACQIRTSTGHDILVLKMDATGNLLWKKQIKGTGLNFISAAVTSNGGCVLLLEHEWPDFPGSDVGLVRLGSNGNVIWKKSFNVGIPDTGSRGLAVTQSADGRFAIIGAVINLFTPGTHGGFFAKISSAGAVVSSTWNIPMDGNSGFIFPASDSGYAVLASSFEGSLFVKLNSNAKLPQCNFLRGGTNTGVFGALKISDAAITIKNWNPRRFTPDIRSTPLTSKNDTKLCP